jgi:hypothetical protein
MIFLELLLLTSKLAKELGDTLNGAETTKFVILC